MYNRTNTRQPRANNGWKKRPFRNNSQSRSRRFTGNTIDIRRFVNKAEKVKTEEIFKPRYSFAELEISDVLKRSIIGRGYKTPTPIQDKAIPVVLSGRDVIGLANTGTGKTAAFLIPIINKILNNPEEKVLIVVPTRELAIQIKEEFSLFTRGMGIYSVVVVGGASIQRQIMELRSRHNVVIGTPGRLKDLIDRKVLNLSRVGNVVLDEADRMLDMGFINDVKLLLSLVAKERQIMLFSATFSAEIEKLVRQFLVNPERISIVTRETSKQIDQDIVRVAGGEDKIEVLCGMLVQTHFEKVLVFTRTKHGADKLCKRLYEKGLKSEAIHGNKPQNRRQRALKMFKDSMINILVATDVAARGLDIPNVSHVINFDVPATYEDYVHRIGRTGRADQKGIALTFVD
ncbi:MAG: DEAD/DEAH RNA helicase [Candidatus Moranbacteria bacterium GW2011_GWE2_35_2-]|nr:MAG: DEAD/DEAH RNA helicase [Candidatus Moranbacteria bacterium GW2011_GWE2_35_2-]KKQ22456.1 MAG: DEAD/DEAH RNA helicase [Candidatus Moranbacteria bacterium GW2011_GWF2_37_11]KKQ29525.1 MAG: DEAD/DEAH RNA helicase [Candidatus Moranbacteria bacterium GW2011_GWD1_37_17]KKQ30605.1 MAG: DEAD/DEAH RNA helicase [Candidatus Moranbacteria bacterium GW2011_GWE1_37_24]KKQ48171.1 MAG: DEAD/DEAH RNA helicase [Candidatus Moranbacteria bacterium GW2011_GWD2_37_9]HBO17152.1 ATP-dependent helicase [Candida